MAVCMNGTTVISAEAPAWTVTAFNKDGYCFTQDMKSWLANGLSPSLRANTKHIKEYGSRIARVTYLGKASSRLVYVQGPSGLEYAGQVLYQTKNTLPRTSRKSYRVTDVFTNDFKLSEGASRFVQGYYGTPSHLPVHLEQSIEGMSKRHFKLRTITIKERSVSLSEFALPKMLKPQKSIQGVLAGRAIQDFMLDITDDVR